MVELVSAIAKSLVDNPDAVEVTESAASKTTVIQLKVAPEDMGKVIGKQGRIAKALRTVCSLFLTSLFSQSETLCSENIVFSSCANRI